MAPKSIEYYREKFARPAFPWPMPGGEPVMVPQPSIRKVSAAVAAARASGSLIDGLRAYLDPEEFGRLEEAWGEMPPAALDAVLADMSAHFAPQDDQDQGDGDGAGT
jgi:hypothetical protein